jgi:hypothetical protein
MWDLIMSRSRLRLSSYHDLFLRHNQLRNKLGHSSVSWTHQTTVTPKTFCLFRTIKVCGFWWRLRRRDPLKTKRYRIVRVRCTLVPYVTFMQKLQCSGNTPRPTTQHISIRQIISAPRALLSILLHCNSGLVSVTLNVSLPCVSFLFVISGTGGKHFSRNPIIKFN